MNIADMFSESSRTVRQNTRARLFAEHRIPSVFHTLAFALLSLLFWGVDWGIDPAQARHTLNLRVVVLVVLILSAVVKWLSSTVLLNWLATYASLALSEVLLIVLLTKLNGGKVAEAGQFLFFCLGSVLLTWHYSFKVNVPGCIVLALVPSLAGYWLVPDFPHILYASMIWPAAALAILIHSKFRPYLVENVRLRQEAESAVLFNPVTGLLNKRGLEHSFQRLVKMGGAKPLQQFLLLIEIDGIARIRDAHGEAAANAVLEQIGQTVDLSFRGRDITSSLGDEFACILLHLSRENAFDIAERFRSTLADRMLKCPGAPNGELACTVSIGIVAADTKERIDSLLNLARVGVNQAKSLGGNHCACI